MISTLLATNLSLSKTELAEKAGISTQSVRNHLPTLVAMGVVDET
ncbi:winged helix-turn-helix transcriptional regulator, partial [Haloferax sp. Atlit-12N]